MEIPLNIVVPVFPEKGDMLLIQGELIQKLMTPGLVMFKIWTK
jgi:hypothetical protein